MTFWNLKIKNIFCFLTFAVMPLQFWFSLFSSLVQNENKMKRQSETDEEESDTDPCCRTLGTALSSYSNFHSFKRVFSMSQLLVICEQSWMESCSYINDIVFRKKKPNETERRCVQGLTRLKLLKLILVLASGPTAGVSTVRRSPVHCNAPSALLKKDVHVGIWGVCPSC